MARVQPGEPTAPFARARAQGFVFASHGMTAGRAALDAAWESRSAPLLVCGPSGAGKKTLLSVWARSRRRGTITVVGLRAAQIVPGRAAEAVLRAFGHRPAPGASASEALGDFLQDCAEDGQQALVIVTDLHEGRAGLLSDLSSLVEHEAGGVGLPLWASLDPDRAPGAALAGEVIDMDPMEEAETASFLEAVLREAGERGATASDDFAAALHRESEGLPGLAGALIDEAYRAASDEGAEVISARHLPGHASGAPNAAPTPEEIEQALIALESGEPAKPDAAPSPPRRKRASYPKIETAEPVRPSFEPANDPARRLDPRIVEDLQRLNREAAALQGTLAVARQQAERLRERAKGRSGALEKAAEVFVNAFGNSPDKQD